MSANYRASVSVAGPFQDAKAPSPSKAQDQAALGGSDVREATSLGAQTGSSGQSLAHESARLQVQGLAPYIDDLPELRGTLHAAPILSPVAHGRLGRIDTQAALAMPGVVDVLLAADIPGDPFLATPAHDEPIFAIDTVQHVGQVVGLVVARTVMQARRAARAVQQQLAQDIEALPAVLDARAAHAQQSYVLPPVTVQRGAPDEALAQAEHHLSGSFEVGGQEHFYLEGQIAYAQPQEGERDRQQWLIHSSSQHPGEVQHWVAHALGLDGHDVQVVCRRMGGGFGGKETQAGHLAVWAALAARKTGAPVKLRLDRDDDFLVTGKRHPFAYDYEVGFDGRGLVTALRLTMLVNCGFSADLSGPVADRAIFHSDNAYYLSDVRIRSYRCKTNTQSHTAFRGFGGPQGVIAIETILGDIARHLGLDALDVRLRNLYSDDIIAPTSATEPVKRRDTTHYQMRIEDNILQPLITRLEKTARYRERRAEIAEWNRSHRVLKKGLAITPVKFGISFTATLFNQAGALVHVYADGSVLVNHGGTEMGQGLHTKIGQIVADELGVPHDWVRLSASDTARVPNASATAASSGTDLNGRAAQFAARSVRDNLAAFVAGLEGQAAGGLDVGAGEIRFAHGQVIGPHSTRDFREVVKAAYANRIQLWSDGFYRTPKIHYDKTTLTGRPFYYFAYGAACSEVAIDTHTGETRVLAVDILHDVGRSINPAIDLGQVEGGFIQGMGWLTSEELVWDQNGKLATHAPSTYKIPATGDLPPRWRVDFWPEANREDNVHGSKAVGEPPFMLAISVWEAIRDAIAAARQTTYTGAPGAPGATVATVRQDGRVPIDAPATPERVFKALHA